jgi:hypothetical protein
MEAESGTPLKVCPHCAVASRTDAEACPSCGKPYVRRLPSLGRWWLAIPIVAAAFLIGYFGLSELIEDEPEGITRQDATGIETGSSPSAVVGRLGEPEAETQLAKGPCFEYVLTDAPQPYWLFCFQEGKLVSSSPLPE